jgi:xanthine dehydrogenase/oxidase
LASLHWRATRTEEALFGKQLTRPRFRALEVLKQEVAERSCSLPEIDEEGISSAYRRSLAESFFYKFFVHVARRSISRGSREYLGRRSPGAAAVTGHSGVTQYPELFLLSKPIIKKAAFVQATGESNTRRTSHCQWADTTRPWSRVRPHARFSLTRLAPSIEASRSPPREVSGFRAGNRGRYSRAATI